MLKDDSVNQGVCRGKSWTCGFVYVMTYIYVDLRVVSLSFSPLLSPSLLPPSLLSPSLLSPSLLSPLSPLLSPLSSLLLSLDVVEQILCHRPLVVVSRFRRAHARKARSRKRTTFRAAGDAGREAVKAGRQAARVHVKPAYGHVLLGVNAMGVARLVLLCEDVRG